MSTEVIKELEDKLKKSVVALKKDFSKLRTGVASVSLLEDIKIDYYNQPTPINQVAAIGVPDIRTITIQPWDNTTIVEIEKAIQRSDLGVNSLSDGKIIRLAFPKLTAERRKELTKLGSKMLENTRVAMRDVRRDINERLKKMEKDKILSQDDLRKNQDEVQNKPTNILNSRKKHTRKRKKRFWQSDDNYAMDKIKLNKLPTHVAIIMDGNGRWARRKKLPRAEDIGWVRNRSGKSLPQPVS